MEEAGLMTYTAASHQGAIGIFWHHYGELFNVHTIYASYAGDVAFQ